MCASFERRRQRGLTLIELLVFIVVVGFGLAGTLVVFQNTVRSSGDPLVRKQALAIAEALMDEVALHPYTYCDPTDANFQYARAANTAAGNCTTTVENSGPEAGQTRYSATTPFNNVNDYAGFAMSPIVRLGNSPAATVAGLESFNATINVTAEAGGLRIDVRVVRGTEDVTLSAYRFMTAPNFGG
ncbi:MAG TPA: prepilin-type N-terminal cleavage/methylation domain-containing protein [Rhodocyclaceae bacterium]|nr:prepilin-type N-terminal cleavage/methylation domain-containing protein [Rhodocyclaceae bacterium]